uniref:Ycf66 n=1 Tax=Wiesnerella denudata TaxID=179049 RepID=A0A7G5XV06_9MARC|nr:Ycf66 [Wiesnerella denudata]QNA49840.1 Ycf66 [Wiesnerella denudata]
MNHMELGPSTILGVGLIIVGILLYALKIREPYVSRDYDFFFSSIGLLCGGILFFQGWRLDPILLLSQILLSGTTIFFIAESIYLRKNINYLKEKKKYIKLKKKYIYKYIYENLKLKKKWDELKYTKHIFYKKKKH